MPDETHEIAHIRALISEIWMMIDHASGTAGIDLAAVKVEAVDTPGTPLTIGQALNMVSTIEQTLPPVPTPSSSPPDMGGQANGGTPDKTVPPTARAQLQLVRDAVGAKMIPASSLSVAYTTMVVGARRSKSASRLSLASVAYAGLESSARGHKLVQRMILIMTILIAFMTVWESAKVALGKALLQNLEALKSQQEVIAREKLAIESRPPPAAQPGQPVTPLPPVSVNLSRYRVCDRPVLRWALAQAIDLKDIGSQSVQKKIEALVSPKFEYDTPDERDVCGRDDVLRVNLGNARAALEQYNEDWVIIASSPFAIAENILVQFVTIPQTALQAIFGAHQSPMMRKADDGTKVVTTDTPATPDVTATDRSKIPNIASGRGPDGKYEDIEVTAGPKLLIWGNFVLPTLFGLIGSAIFVVLSFYQKVANFTLLPQDRLLEPIRLALGLIVGSCIGLFFNNYIPPIAAASSNPTGASVLSSLYLSASGWAFLASFGADAMFRKLSELVNNMLDK